MRRLNHPKLEDINVEGILHALSDPVRVRIFMDLACAGSAKNCTNYVNVGALPLAKSTLSQHFKILREAGLIYSERKGVELHNSTRCSELKETFGEMIGAIVKAYTQQHKTDQGKR